VAAVPAGLGRRASARSAGCRTGQDGVM